MTYLTRITLRCNDRRHSNGACTGNAAQEGFVAIERAPLSALRPIAAHFASVQVLSVYPLPYGIPTNTFNSAYISGASSGSASVAARSIVPFALDTATAGSGQVPAGPNNSVGIKPTCGAFSNTGVVPPVQSKLSVADCYL